MKTILCFGDSNTYGLVPVTHERYPRDVRWTGILQKKLGAEYYVIEEGHSGRTTLWDDPIEMESLKSGKNYLLPCLESHRPIDLVVLMLGTNDLKVRFSLSPFDISAAVENLVKTIQQSDKGINHNCPKILLVAPVPIKSVGDESLDQMFGDDMEIRSQSLGHFYELVAERCKISYINPGASVEVSDLDGIHYTEKGHAVMADLLEPKIKEILC